VAPHNTEEEPGLSASDPDEAHYGRDTRANPVPVDGATELVGCDACARVVQGRAPGRKDLLFPEFTVALP